MLILNYPFCLIYMPLIFEVFETSLASMTSR